MFIRYHPDLIGRSDALRARSIAKGEIMKTTPPIGICSFQNLKPGNLFYTAKRHQREGDDAVIGIRGAMPEGAMLVPVALILRKTGEHRQFRLMEFAEISTQAVDLGSAWTLKISTDPTQRIALDYAPDDTQLVAIENKGGTADLYFKGIWTAPDSRQDSMLVKLSDGTVDFAHRFPPERIHIKSWKIYVKDDGFEPQLVFDSLAQ
ncbi:hypothetical protein [Undibacterium sp.]|jgi:hypothetical protein|uniref:hypothetical protein n=1 Tax=Undibacterium sp. TaxID=1914977 RepID=UPI002B5E437F|nr:hypothetical protein [Undibacterium sp.]HTD06634.1 hypothetical protein [Undibacterium sp.]